ncbi:MULTISPECIES: amidohydrolase family protein [Phyllobacteriaceae]|jgi:predicted amidohydrolase YtcJ|nr:MULTISPECIES: amidohydrolase family protein [Mesorhizobium]MBN9236172.1 amidohydrolase family protein [Mesorhizobium sp.]MDQ0328153.1 putative amidohydrolase YtcJ [Mesorhizobium sp. YL-MeA3-2017]
MLAYLRDHGVTGLLEAISDEDTVRTVSEMDKTGTLNMRFEASYRIGKPGDVETAMTTLRRWRSQYGTAHVGAHTVKFFLDGTNEIGTSSLLAPFSNGAKSVEPAMTKEELAGVLVKLNQADMDMHLHMVGDRAFRTALDAVEIARKTVGAAWKQRVTFAHCELIDDADFARVVDLDVTLNWTPHWSGGYFQGNEPYLGQERHDNEYRFQPVIAFGGRITYGSGTVSKQEWDRSDPFFGMQIAHTRRDIEKGLVSDLIRKPASEMLQLQDLVAGYTRNSAYQLRLDDKAGTLQKGKSADFMILDRNLLHTPALEVSKVTPKTVIFEGRVVSGHF